MREVSALWFFTASILDDGEIDPLLLPAPQAVPSGGRLAGNAQLACEDIHRPQRQHAEPRFGKTIRCVAHAIQHFIESPIPTRGDQCIKTFGDCLSREPAGIAGRGGLFECGFSGNRVEQAAEAFGFLPLRRWIINDARPHSATVFGATRTSPEQIRVVLLLKLGTRHAELYFAIMFRPCIDLRDGKVVQIVGGTLGNDPAAVRTNFVSERPAAWFAELYKRDGLTGGHVIMLGAGNDAEARAALAAYPGGLQIGGGVNVTNARVWLDAGASHVIVTSWVFRDGKVDWERLAELVKLIGKDRLVLDLSCRKRDGNYFVVTDRWQKFTDVTLSAVTLGKFSRCCAEFLVHAVDVEGLCRGIDGELVSRLGEWAAIPVTYAGGANSLADLETVTRLGQGKIGLTIGSALDIFGGKGVRYADAVAFNRRALTQD